MKYNRLALILGNCLFPDHDCLSPDKETLFFMAEDFDLCTHFKYHKHKLVLFLSAMRSHAETIQEQWDIQYHQLNENNKTQSYEDKIKDTIDTFGIKELVTYDIEDHFLQKRIERFCEEQGLLLRIVDSPGFISTKEEFATYDASVKKPFMHTFYQRQRKSMNLLVNDDNSPWHGQWSFDSENRKKLPKNIHIPARPTVQKTKHDLEVIQLVDELFPQHHGDTANFNWATTRREALSCLDNFLKERFQHFGPYEDAIDKEGVFLFHSVLSPYLNMGLLTPSEVIDKALGYSKTHEIHYPSLEGFVRQIIGWREFMRGIYHQYDSRLQKNFFGHKRHMKPCWYTASTGIPPLDDSINKAHRQGYTHHIERLMILGNIMLLCELHPDEVYRWFMEMYVDSADWVMTPNVYGMSQFSDGGLFATKPYIGGSNYIIKMSNYKKSGEWPEILNGLYWRFINVNREVFIKNPRMSMMTRTLDRMPLEKKEKLMALADGFIEKVTTMEEADI